MMTKVFSLTLSLVFTAVTSSCTGAAPIVVVRKASTDAQVGSVPADNKSGGLSSNAGSPKNKLNTQKDGNAEAVQNGSGVEGEAIDDGQANEDGKQGGSQQGSALGFLWLPIGDFPASASQLSRVSQCANPENVIRSACQSANSLCKSSFQVTCDQSSDCRRLFKCTSGQTGGLIWFPMGDNITLSSNNSQICPVNSNIAGSACSSVNERCLSNFCTSGSGDACGRRLFKCLTSGEPGKLFWRWVEDKPSGELAALNICTEPNNIAGSPCSSMNDKCQSSFCAEGTAPNCTKRRLFKCTP
jgi:hypothetical protein